MPFKFDITKFYYETFKHYYKGMFGLKVLYHLVNPVASKEQPDYHYNMYEKKRKLEDLDVSYLKELMKINRLLLFLFQLYCWRV